MSSNPKTRLAFIVLAAGLTLTACDEGTPTAGALRKAKIDLMGLHPEGAHGPSVAQRDQVYTGMVTSLKSVADQGRDGETAAAYLLIAQAQAGLAETPASLAADQEQDSLNRGQAVRDALAQYIRLSALSQASGSYDPSKDLADIDAQIKERLASRLLEQQKQAAVDTQVAEIRAKAKAKSDEAKARREESGRLKSEMANQTATKAETTLRQAQTIGRQADAMEVEASTLEAQAAKIAPQSGEIQLEIDRLTAQKELAERAKAATLKRAEEAKAHASAAAAEAAAAAKRTASLVQALDEQREKELAPQTEKAASMYEASAASAKRAVGDAKATGQMTIGSAKQSLGDVLWGQAHGLVAYADVMDSLVAAKPGLPDESQYKAKADKARAEAKAALDKATEAYKAANAAYTAAGGSAELRERTEAINARLAAIVKITSGGSEDIGVPETEPKQPDPAPAGGDGATTAAAPTADSPQATIQKLVDAIKTMEFGSLDTLFAVNTAEDRRALRTVFGSYGSYRKLDDALKAKFGKGLPELPGQAMGGAGVDPAKFMNLDTSSLNVQIDGDTATAQMPTGNAMRLVRKDGKWLIDAASMGVNAASLGPVLAQIEPMVKALDDLAADVRAGKFADHTAALQAFAQSMMGGLAPPAGKKK